MAIQSATGNIQHGVQNNIQGDLQGAISNVQGIVANAGAGLSTSWGKDFAGMNYDALQAVKQSIERYCQKLEDTISAFPTDTGIHGAIHGPAEEPAKQFVNSVKDLMKAYVSKIRKENDELEEAWNNYQVSTQQIGQSAASDAENVRSQANNINIAPGGGGA